MKLTMATMGVGVLALSGVPPFSGFWSKDLIFHEAWSTGNYIPLVLVALAAVITLIYSLKMFWLVFMGDPREGHEGHESPLNMTLPLILLAIGGLVSWVSISYFTEGLVTYNFLDVHHIGLMDFVTETFTSVPFIISAVILVIGGVLFKFRWTLGNILKDSMSPVYKLMSVGYGFDIVYNKFVTLLKHGAWGAKRTQTGDSNYNVLGIVIALLVVIAVFWFYGGVL